MINLQKEKILLLGSKGVVGSAILRKFNELGYSNIISLDKQSLDLTEIDDVKRKFIEVNPSYIINAAAKVGSQSANIEDPINFLEDNIKIQMNIYGSLKYINVKKIINFASIYIYPENYGLEISEDSLLCGPLNKNYENYSLAKILGIKYLEILYKTRGIFSTTLVLPNVYGQNDCLDLNRARLIPSIFIKLQSEGVACFHGNGKQIREFINSDDVADATLYFLSTNHNEGLVNIGNDEYLEIDKIVQKVAKFLPANNKYVWADSDSENKEKPFLISKNKMRKLGWNPKIDLDSGLSSFYFWLTNDIE